MRLFSVLLKEKCVIDCKPYELLHHQRTILLIISVGRPLKLLKSYVNAQYCHGLSIMEFLTQNAKKGNRRAVTKSEEFILAVKKCPERKT